MGISTVVASRSRRAAAVLALLVAGTGAVVLPGAGASAQGAPSASVAPASGLADGQAVTVDAAGFAPSAALVVVQCRTGGTFLSGCDLGATGQPAQADGEGAFTGTVDVARRLYVGDGVVDCAAAGACEVLVAAFDGATVDPAAQARAAVAFDAGLPAPDPEVVTTDCSAAHPLLDPIPGDWQFRSYRAAGARVNLEVDGSAAVLHVAWDGEVRVLTTAPMALGVPTPPARGDTSAFWGQGSIGVVAPPGGGVYVVYRRGTEYVWRLDAACAPPVVEGATTPPPSATTGAGGEAAVEGATATRGRVTPSFTG